MFDLRVQPLDSTVEFKVLLNDKLWEVGSNHKVEYGEKKMVIPVFAASCLNGEIGR